MSVRVFIVFIVPVHIKIIFLVILSISNNGLIIFNKTIFELKIKHLLLNLSIFNWI